MKTATQSHILIVNGHDAFRKSLKRILKQILHHSKISDATSKSGTLNRIKQEKPDILLLDFDLYKKIKEEIISVVHRSSPACKIIYLISHKEALFTSGIKKNGAVAYIDKQNIIEQLEPVLRKYLPDKAYRKTESRKGRSPKGEI